MTNDLMMQPQKWITDNGKELQLTVEDVKKYFTENEKVTDKECLTFLQLCSSHKLDPWTKDAYLVKFKEYAAQLIVGKNAVLKIAHRNKAFDGCQAGVIVLDKSGKIEHREGSMVYPEERLAGGWAKAFRKDQRTPFYDEVSLKEYGKEAQWKTMPATMIRKVALVHVLREAFPEDLSGIYDESEVNSMRNAAEGNKESTEDRINNIFNKTKDEPIDAEFSEVVEGENASKSGSDEINKKATQSDILLNELKIYVKAIKLSDEKINQLFEKNNVSSFEELTDEVKQKCIDRLKPQYEALKNQGDK